MCGCERCGFASVCSSCNKLDSDRYLISERERERQGGSAMESLRGSEKECVRESMCVCERGEFATVCSSCNKLDSDRFLISDREREGERERKRESERECLCEFARVCV